MKVHCENEKKIILSSQEATGATLLSGSLLLGAISLFLFTDMPTVAGWSTIAVCLLVVIWSRQFFYNWQLELDQLNAQLHFRKKRLLGSIREELKSLNDLQAIETEYAGEGTSRLIFVFQDQTITPSKVFSSSDKSNLRKQLEDFIQQRKTLH